ncbi:hypothetical protein ACWCXB_24130 [Streptomyces sp. NPDC001514]
MSPRGERAADVPMAWLCAQEAASRLLAPSGAYRPQASFEYRAAHDVLALTLLFRGRDSVPSESPAGRRELRTLVADDVAWAVWCQARLGPGSPDLSCADRDLAGRAWGRLTASRLLGGSLDDALGACANTATCRGAGVSVGLAVARQLLDARSGQQP